MYNMHNKSGTGSTLPTPVILLEWNAVAVEVIITLQYVASCRQHEEHVARRVTLREFVVAQQKNRSRHQRNLGWESQAPHGLRPTLIQTQSHSSLLTLYMKSHICWHLASPVSDYPLFTFPSNAKPIVVTAQVNNVDLPMELDTGASHL